MRPAVDWQSAFVAFGTLLGEPVDVVIAALPPEPTAGVSELLRELASPSREARARVVARVATDVMARLDAPEPS